MTTPALTTTCVIAGGGPAGMMLGLMLARRGIDVSVLEKHADFLRDFRGDTLHPSTLEVMRELGLDQQLLALPHETVSQLSAEFGRFQSVVADFSHLPVTHPFIALMPQWDFLSFLAGEASKYPNFVLRRKAEAVGLVESGGRVTGVRVRTAEGEFDINAQLVIDATGRNSPLRSAAGLTVRDLGAPIDVFWFRLSRQPGDSAGTGGRFERGGVLVRIYRGDYWQCAYVIPKGMAGAVRERGIEAFRAEIAKFLPFAPERLTELESFDDVKLLSVSVDRLETWFRPGFLCIGDAAHAMSPIGGVGINLAIQDAVAAANILSGPLLRGDVATGDLEAVQKRRMFPTRVTQAAQVFVQNNFLSPALASKDDTRPPLFVRLLARFPYLRRLPARMVGMGVRPEHVAEAPRGR